MATVPTPFHFTALAVPTAANMNAGIEDALTFLLAPPACQVYRSSGLSLSNNSWGLVSWDAESWDNDTMHSTSSNTSRLVFTTAGRYLLCVNAWFDVNSTGSRAVNLTRNGAGTRSSSSIVLSDAGAKAADTAATQISATLERSFSAGDYIEMFAWQNSGGSLTLTAGSNGTTLSARRVSS